MFLSGKKLLNCGEQKKSESIIRQPTKSPFNLAFGSKGHGETIKSIDEVLSSADSAVTPALKVKARFLDCNPETPCARFHAHGIVGSIPGVRLKKEKTKK
jgi:hypothetical protein